MLLEEERNKRLQNSGNRNARNATLQEKDQNALDLMEIMKLKPGTLFWVPNGVNKSKKIPPGQTQGYPVFQYARTAIHTLLKKKPSDNTRATKAERWNGREDVTRQISKVRQHGVHYDHDYVLCFIKETKVRAKEEE